jgi:hypothetical protein
MPTRDTADPLARALDQAVAGTPAALHALLARGSRLPGTRMNAELADAFAEACRARGARADSVALAMSRLSADEAPGATAREFLPVCGVLAIAGRAATDEHVRARFVGELHARADDLRFRVRDAVVDALSRIGAAAGDALVVELASWMDGYFHAAAVLRALENPSWLGRIRDAGALVARLDEAFVLARDAPRAAARWPGHKALVDALSTSPGSIAAAVGVPVFDMLERWAAVPDPVLRDALRATLCLRKLAGRFGPELDRVTRALEASTPAPRNPDHDVGPTRDRSRSKRRRGR